MKEGPILFSAEMVRAILEGRKTQTRRVMIPQPPKEATSAGLLTSSNEWQWLSGDPKDCDTWETIGDWFRCKYGAPGDRLWVRETFLLVGGNSPSCRVVYKASNDGPDAWISPVWRPSIFMPRWASRITLEITDVRVERVQDISGEDAIAEGIQIPRCGCEICAHSSEMCPADKSAAIMAYAELWGKINAKRQGGIYAWEKNPWVWRLESRRVNEKESKEAVKASRSSRGEQDHRS